MSDDVDDKCESRESLRTLGVKSLSRLTLNGSSDAVHVAFARARATLRAPMRISSIDPAPFHSFPYRSAVSGGGTETRACAINRGVVDVLPRDIDALVVTADLQGVVGHGRANRLLGSELAMQLVALALDNAIPPVDRIGVVIAGDMYSAPAADQRGASGDVRDVWAALASQVQVVVGVAGNHDTFGTSAERIAFFAKHENAHLLDGTVVDVGGMKFGGVGGIIGDPKKPQRKSERDFLRMVQSLRDQSADVIITHQGADTLDGRRGAPAVRALLVDHPPHPTLAVCGHCWWPDPLAALHDDVQALNVDSRVIVLTLSAAVR